MENSSRAAVAERISRFSWVHSIDLGQGLVTPGQWGPPSPIIVQAFDSIDFRDKKVLDIGCWDGLWSFEAERRGAREVHATDFPSQRPDRGSPTLLTAREILGSAVRYSPDLSVYDAPARFPERDFDIVIFAGVYYHLKNPLLALTRLRQVLKTGGVIVVEGDVIEDLRRSYATFWYADWWGEDRSNWWIPTIRCLREWMECSFFTVRDEYRARRGLLRRAASALRAPLRRSWYPGVGRPGRRLALVADAVSRPDANYLFPDPELRAFDLNVYR